MKQTANKLVNYFYCCWNWFLLKKAEIRLWIISIPHNYLNKDQLEILNDSVAAALKREEQIFNSIDYLVIEAAASGYFNSEDIYQLCNKANKNEIKALFNFLRMYKSVIENAYYSITPVDVVEIPFNLIALLKDIQNGLNYFMKIFTDIRKNAHIQNEKLHFDDYYQSIPA